jgi:hypothetical protein
MTRDLDNEQDSKQIKDSLNKKRDFIKLNEKRTMIRLISKKYVSEFVHPIYIGDTFYNIPCLGGIEKGGYDPDGCPACKEAKKHWDARKEITKDKLWKNKKDLKAKYDFENEFAHSLQTKHQTTFVAVKGEAIKMIDAKGRKVWTAEFEENAQFLNLSKAQYTKLTEDVFTDYEFMQVVPEGSKSKWDNLVNRNLIFDKVAKKNSDSEYTEVEIYPCEEISEMPVLANAKNPPNLDTVFQFKDEKEFEDLISQYVESFTSSDDEEKEDEPKKKSKIEEDEEDDGLPKKSQNTRTAFKDEEDDGLPKKSFSKREDDKF